MAFRLFARTAKEGRVTFRIFANYKSNRQFDANTGMPLVMQGRELRSDIRKLMMHIGELLRKAFVTSLVHVGWATVSWALPNHS